MVEQIKALVAQYFEDDRTGHGMDHVNRVYQLAMDFTAFLLAHGEAVDKEDVILISLLHDVDDYKFVGIEHAEKLLRTRAIMAQLHIDKGRQERVCHAIRTMGYSNYLSGIRPTSLAGQIVSDADMCDACGTMAIIRSIVYAVSDKGNGLIFDQKIFPNVNITRAEYNSQWTTHETDSAINHLFEKCLKLSRLMLTAPGKKEAASRQQIMIDFLSQFFKEERVPQWQQFMDAYLLSLEDLRHE